MSSGTVRITKRQTPTIIDIKNENLDWEQVNSRLETPTLLERFALLFVGWKTVLAPVGTPCAITTLRDVPIYRYKELKGRVFQLCPAPSPGFPGN